MEKIDENNPTEMPVKVFFLEKWIIIIFDIIMFNMRKRSSVVSLTLVVAVTKKYPEGLCLSLTQYSYLCYKVPVAVSRCLAHLRLCLLFACLDIYSNTAVSARVSKTRVHTHAHSTRLHSIPVPVLHDT